MLIGGGEADRNAKTILSFSATLPVGIFGAIHENVAKQARYIPETAVRAPRRGGWLLRSATLNPPLDDADLKDSALTHLPNAERLPAPRGRDGQPRR